MTGAGKRYGQTKGAREKLLTCQVTEWNGTRVGGRSRVVVIIAHEKQVHWLWLFRGQPRSEECAKCQNLNAFISMTHKEGTVELWIDLISGEKTCKSIRINFSSKNQGIQRSLLLRKKFTVLTNKQQLDQSGHQNKPRLDWIGNWTTTGCE